MPSATKPANKTILVAGDVTADWNIARARAHLGELTTVQYVWGGDIATRASSQPGGAALLTTLLQALTDRQSGNDWSVIGPSVTTEALNNPGDSRYTRSYAVWTPYPEKLGAERMVWRVKEFWGIDAASGESDAPTDDGGDSEPWGLVIDDADLGFRNQESHWPKGVSNPSSKTAWVVLKMAGSLATGPLWDHVLAKFGDRLILLVSLGDLRKADLQIGYALSWEQISAEIVTAVNSHSALSKPARLVVSLGPSGAVVIDRTKENTLIFDPRAQGDDWERQYPGMCIGYASCYVTAIVRALVADAKDPELAAAARRGVHSARKLHKIGYGQGDGTDVVDLRFPVDAVIDALDDDDVALSTVALPGTPGSHWNILAEVSGNDLGEVARAVVASGAKASLQSVPVERIGGWASVDRGEIESMRSLRNIVAEYMAQRNPSRPLSIAVFGPPGSGKSFAIRELAKTLMPDKLHSLEYNLSQFESPAELPSAFHSVRDCALKQQLPLVFWDEFDTPLQGRALGWLRYFLAPMQDGQFREAGSNHPIGPAIFVFAGGVHSSMADFREVTEAKPEAKGRDFLSRLRGFLNVLGPNAQNEDDTAAVLRRALLLRSLLQRNVKQLFDREEALRIDGGILRAFLEVAEYRHGARSMEAIISMSALSGKLKFERSCLAAKHQLDIHVDADAFLHLVSAVDGHD